MPQAFPQSGHCWRTIACSHCGQMKRVPERCRDRFCPVCSGSARRRASRRIYALCEKATARNRQRLRFLTLTLKSTDDPATQRSFMVASFRKLRSTRMWKDRVSGGVWVLEVTHSPAGWHLHAHVIIQGEFIAQQTLSQAWRRISGASVVDIRALPNTRTAASYVSKYVTKSDVPEEYRSELANCYAGQRFFQPFGEWAGITVTLPDPDFCCDRCGHRGWVVLHEHEWVVNDLVPT
jgi:hypothetical protein